MSQFQFERELFDRIGQEKYLQRLEKNRYLLRAVGLKPLTARKLVKSVRAAEFVLIQAKLRRAHEPATS